MQPPKEDDHEEHVKAQARVLASILESAETLRGDLRKLAKAARNDIQIHQLVMEGGLLFPEALQDFKFAGEVDPFVKKWADSFRDIRQMYAQMNSLQSIESWVSDPYLRLGEIAKQVEADKLAYESALKKVKNKSQRALPDGASPKEVKLSDARKDYEASMLLYVGRLTETMNHLRAEFLDRLTSCMFAAESFFTAGGAIMTHLAPSMSEKRSLLDKERAAFVDRLTNLAESQASTPPSKTALESLADRAVPRVGIVREGRLLLKKTAALGANWRLRIFQIKEDGTLIWFKGREKPKPGRGKVNSINLVLSTARPLHDAKHEHAFEILTPDQSKYVLRAASAEEMNDWLNAFKLSISSGLAQGTSMTSDADREKTKTAPELGPELKLLVERNPECADCGNEQPTWVSITIGVLVCHECSGAHRSLGTHISKIKSLTLDKWESHTIEIMKALGNKRCNNFWEHTIPESHHKPLATSKTPLKHQWIIAKYRDKMFTPQVSTPISPSVLFQKLFVALSKDDILTATRVVALGAEVSAHTNPDGKTLLHGAAEEGRVLILEFLIINGADFNARDDDGRWPLHLAAQSGHLDCVKLLLARQGENAAHDADNNGMSPLDHAKEGEFQAIIAIMRPAPSTTFAPHPPGSPRLRKKDVFRRTLSVKPGKEVHSSKLRRVISGVHANDAAVAKDMVEQERVRRPSIFQTNPVDSVHLYRPSTSGSQVPRRSSGTPAVPTDRITDGGPVPSSPLSPSSRETTKPPTSP